MRMGCTMVCVVSEESRLLLAVIGPRLDVAVVSCWLCKQEDPWRCREEIPLQIQSLKANCTLSHTHCAEGFGVWDRMEGLIEALEFQ